MQDNNNDNLFSLSADLARIAFQGHTRIEAFRCGYCRDTFTASEMMRAYREGCCQCGEPADSWERSGQVWPIFLGRAT